MRWFGRRDSDYREELESHIEMLVRTNLERGLDPEAARQAALRTFGNVLTTRESLQEANPVHFLDILWRDVRHGARLLMRTPGLTAIIVLTLALGIGANTAIFSLVEAVILRTLPVRDPHSLVIVRALTRQGVPDWFSHQDYTWLRNHTQQFSDLAADANWKFTLDSGEYKERVNAEFVSGNYFPMLGLQPAAGRLIAPDDEHQSRPVAVITYAFWQREMGGRADVLGRELRLEKNAYEVIGVGPAGFRGDYGGDGGDFPDLWLPLTTPGPQRAFLNKRNSSWLGILGRLRPGVTEQAAQAGMGILLENLRRDLHVDPQNDYLGRIRVQPGAGGLSYVRDYFAQPLRLLMALVAIVLLIACANVANLLLARGDARRREFAVRLALGASRLRLFRQLLTESFMLSGLACASGLVIAEGIARVLVATANVRGLEVHLNGSVLTFAAMLSCAAAVAFGMAPAVQSNHVDPWTALKEGKLPAGPLHRIRLSTLLVVAQTAFSVVLLIAAGLLLRTFWNLKSVNPGFDQTVLEAQLDTSPVDENGVALGNKLVERLSSVKGVQTVSYSRFGFGQGSNRVCCMAPEGYTAVPDEDKNVRVEAVSPGYFRTQGIPLIAGRDFTAADRYGAPTVAIINETTARHYFRGVNPLGKRFAWWPTDPKDTEIVGVARDTKYDDLKEQTPRLIYQPILQQGPGPNFIQIRASVQSGRSTSALIADCRAIIRGANQDIRVTSFEPIRNQVLRTLAPEILESSLSTGFGVLALLLTAVGLYGVLAYAVARRTSEFGIRLALGAEASTLLGSVMSKALVLVSTGIISGTVAAVFLTRLMTKLLFGVPAFDLPTFASAAAILLIVAAAASYRAARRATVVDPVTALRYE